jgi:cullin-associated NEDD8-dissociated protein 1
LTEELETLIKLALQETPIKKELITTIDLGPFKHTVDNGAPIRKSSFSLLQNLTEKF